MDELGSILREAREAKGQSLNDAEQKTRINRRFLEALENAEYHLLPTPVHVRGYLRNYARHLNLDPKPLLERYELSKSQRPSPSTNGSVNNGSVFIPDRQEQPFFDPVNVQLHDNENGGNSLQRLAIIIALLFTIGLVANRFIPLLRGEGDGTNSLTSSINEAVDSIINNNESPSEEEASAMLESAIPGANDPITSTNRNNSDNDTIVLDLPTPTATRPRLPATLDQINLRLDITERSWLRVTVDGEITFEGLAKPNDTFEWQADQEVTLLTGNGIGVFVTINDVQLGKLGGRSQIVEENWTTTEN